MKRVLAMLLALVMVLSLLPVTALMAFAEEQTGPQLVTEEPTEEPAEEPTEAPAEESVEEVPVEETPVEEPPVEETTVEEEPAEDPATRSTEPTGGEYSCGYDDVHYVGTVNGNQASVAETGEVILCADNFPDAAFRSYVAENIDTDSNGLLNADELLTDEIDCREWGIVSLQGIQYFAELDTLMCQGNALTSLDVSALPKLRHLHCQDNYLTELDVSQNPALFYLYCDYNQLTELDVSNNPELASLECQSNLLTELDVSQNPELTVLFCNDNALSNLNVASNPKLRTLHCINTGLTELDLSQNPALVYLNCYGNNLTELDVSVNSGLKELSCSSNALTTLDVSNNPALEYLSCGYNGLTELNVSGCTNLYYLDCSENQIAELDVSALTGLEKLYCSHNQLTALDVSNNTKLDWINCFVNDLTELDLSGLTNLTYVDCSTNALTKLDLTGCTALETVQCYDQYWNGYLPLAVNAEEGTFVADMTGITDMTRIVRIYGDGWATDPNGNTITFDYNPNEVGFTYDYFTGWGDHMMTVHINASQDGGSGGDDGGETEILIVPELDAMTQLTLNETYIADWTDEEDYLWFYFQPEEDVFGTFLTLCDMPENPEERIDPWAYLVGEDGTVLTSNDDNDSWNSGIAVDFIAGETYIFAVRARNNTGDLPVAILEGDHTQGGSPGDGPGYEEDFSDIAPPLEEMTALTLGEDYTATIESAGGYAWFTFTPEEDGTYSFFSEREENTYLDPYGYLLNEELEVLNQNDDGAGNWNFSLTGALEAGQTYVLAAKLLGDSTGSYTVKVATALEITDISVKDISIPEGSWCGYQYTMTDEGLEAHPYYRWYNKMEVTLTFSDGSTATGTGTNIIHNGISYELYTSDRQDYGIVDWKAGNTYEVEIYTADGAVATTADVKITSSQIKSISVDDMVIMENTCGDWYGEDEVDWFCYNWEEALNWTVTFKDGKKLSGTGRYFEYKDNVYEFGCLDSQYGGSPWTAGNTYTGTVVLGSKIKNVDITIRGTTEELARVQNLRVTSVGQTSIKIAYDPVEGAERYEIYVNGGYWGNTTKTTYTVSGLTLGDSYDISVAAAKKVDGAWRCGPVSESFWARTYKDISDYYVKLEYTSTVFDGTAKYPEATLKTSSSGKTIASENYWLSYGWLYGDNTAVGQGLVILQGMGNYGGVILKDFKILPQQVTGVQVTDITSDSVTITFDPVEGATEYWVYRGDTRVAKITDTTYTYTGLKAGTTYKFSVRANAVVDEYQWDDYDPYKDELPDTEEKNYTGKASEKVSAKPVYRLEECSAEPKDIAKAYTGKKVTNSFTVKHPNGKTLKKDTDYTVSYENNKEMGIATAILKGKGKYAGELRVEFAIGPKAPKDVDVDVINGNALEVSFDTVKGAYGYIIFLDGEVYGATMEDECIIEGLNPGQKYSITVRAVMEIDNEENPMVPGAASKAVTATPRFDIEEYTSPELPGGYEYVYTGKSIKPAFNLYGPGEELLVEGVDYTLSYKNNKNSGIATIKVTGKGRFKGTGELYFYIYPAAVKNLKISSTTKTSVKLSWSKTSSAKYYDIYEVWYDEAGNVTEHGRVARTTGSSYTIKNLVAGELHYYVVIASKDVKMFMDDEPWTMPLQTSSEVITAWAGTEIDDYKVTLEYTSAVYNGEPHEPVVTVKTSSKSSAKTLVEGVDYTVTYENNEVPGKAKVIIRGIGVYTGSISKTFKIVPGQVQNVWAEARTNTTMDVMFDAVPGATEYWVYVNGDREAKITDTACVIKGLKKGKTYKVTVKAVAKVDGTNYSGELSEVVKCYMVPKDQV